MTIHKYVPRKEDVIRIEAIEIPSEKAQDEGLYEWRHMSDNVSMDILTLEKELERVLPGHSEYILDRLQNFRKVFINLATKEVST